MSETTKQNKQGVTIILSAFATIGGLALTYIFFPQEPAKEVVMTAIGLIGGFIAGRSAK